MLEEAVQNDHSGRTHQKGVPWEIQGVRYDLEVGGYKCPFTYYPSLIDPKTGVAQGDKSYTMRVLENLKAQLPSIPNAAMVIGVPAALPKHFVGTSWSYSCQPLSPPLDWTPGGSETMVCLVFYIVFHICVPKALILLRTRHVY